MVSIAVAVPYWDVGASAFVYSAWSVAISTGIECSNAVVDIVAGSISVGISRTVSSADA